MKYQYPYILILLLGCSFVLTAQNPTNYTSTPFKIEKAAVQNMSSVEQGFDLDIKYLEAPAPDGDSYWGALLEQKTKSAA